VIVLDASAALDMLLRTPHAERVEGRVLRPNQAVHAPHLIDVEIAQALRRQEARGADAETCRLALMHWLAMPLERHSHDAAVVRAWELRSNFTAYDAVYIALAEILDAPLITRDRKLVSELHEARVEVI